MALDVASRLLDSGGYDTLLIVSSDKASVGLDWEHDIETAGNFGDGAAAFILRRGATAEDGITILASRFETHSEGVAYCQIPGGGSRYHPARTLGDYVPYGFFQMQGKEVFRLTSRVMPPFVDAALQQAGVGRKEVRWAEALDWAWAPSWSRSEHDKGRGACGGT